MNVVVLDPQSSEGLASYDHNLCSNIPDSKIVLIGNEKYDYIDEQKEYEFYPSFKYKKYSQPFRTISYLNSLRYSVKYIVKQMPDIVHIQWLKVPRIDTLFLNKIKKENIPIVYTVHNILPHDSGNKYFKIFKHIYQNIADRLIVHTTETKRNLIDDFDIEEKKIVVIPHGLHKLKLDKALFEDKKEKIRRIMKKNNKIVFSFLGNLTYYKGFDLVIEAWEKSNILSKNKNLMLVVAGRNKYSSKLINRLNKYENVHFDIRELTNEEFEAYLELSDVVLLPYRRISQSGVLLSSINRSKPFIVSNVGGLTDPFKIDKNCGWIMDSIHWHSLEKEILKALQDYKNISASFFSELTWRKIKNAYSWKNIGYTTRKLYEQIYVKLRFSK
jgi:glycosyltransferase involved in cell wall biosynthesis